jgi:hypothetical protein
VPVAVGGGEVTAPPPEPRGGGLPKPLLALAGLLLVLVVGAVLWATLGGSDEDDEAAADDSPATTTSTTPPDTADTVPGTTGSTTPAERVDGVSNARSAEDPELVDTSDALRARIDAFAAASSSTSVKTKPIAEQGGIELDFGTPPAVIDFAATNIARTPTCRKVYLDGLTVQGAAATVWFDGEQVVLVNSVQLGDELAARRYYWATTMFLGLRAEHCSGWPADGVALNPTELGVDRVEFPVTGADEVFTMIDPVPKVQVVKTGPAYQSVLRIGDKVLIVSVAWLEGDPDAGPAPASAVVDEVVAAFTRG